jgi:hypothetical protein
MQSGVLEKMRVVHSGSDELGMVQLYPVHPGQASTVRQSAQSACQNALRIKQLPEKKGRRKYADPL